MPLNTQELQTFKAPRAPAGMVTDQYGDVELNEDEEPDAYKQMKPGETPPKYVVSFPNMERRTWSRRPGFAFRWFPELQQASRRAMVEIPTNRQAVYLDVPCVDLPKACRYADTLVRQFHVPPGRITISEILPHKLSAQLAEEFGPQATIWAQGKSARLVRLDQSRTRAQLRWHNTSTEPQWCKLSDLQVLRPVAKLEETELFDGTTPSGGNRPLKPEKFETPAYSGAPPIPKQTKKPVLCPACQGENHERCSKRQDPSNNCTCPTCYPELGMPGAPGQLPRFGYRDIDNLFDQPTPPVGTSPLDPDEFKKGPKQKSQFFPKGPPRSNSQTVCTQCKIGQHQYCEKKQGTFGTCNCPTCYPGKTPSSTMPRFGAVQRSCPRCFSSKVQRRMGQKYKCSNCGWEGSEAETEGGVQTPGAATTGPVNHEPHSLGDTLCGRDIDGLGKDTAEEFDPITCPDCLRLRKEWEDNNRNYRGLKPGDPDPLDELETAVGDRCPYCSTGRGDEDTDEHYEWHRDHDDATDAA
jgi:predicted RNA-binding Zn-ribbon protein involved in translation (DUF1610 family)